MTDTSPNDITRRDFQTQDPLQDDKNPHSLKETMTAADVHDTNDVTENESKALGAGIGGITGAVLTGGNMLGAVAGAAVGGMIGKKSNNPSKH